MGDSNAEWGALAAHDDEMAETWDGFGRLPEPGENAALDSFVERKGISHASLVRLGARLTDTTVLAFAFPGGIKFRDLVTDRRWSYYASEWRQLKIVRAGLEPTPTVILAEGESDAAWLSDHYEVDVAVLPAGADPRPHTAAYAEQLSSYELVLLGQDDDRAGDEGAALLQALLPQAMRFKPPANDWCAVDGDAPSLPDPSEVTTPVEAQLLVSAGDLLDLEPPSMISWYEQALLPVAGQLVLHGAWKSFKSFLALDLLAALAQGQDWCTFEPTEEPCRVAVMQYEIPWAYYQQRVKLLRDHARQPDLFDSNFLTFTPLRRPAFTAGNTAQEDIVLRTLEQQDVQIFLLDPIRRATGAVDINTEKDVRPLLDFAARLQDNGVTVIFTHHDNKASVRSGGGDTSGMTGSGAFAGDADTLVTVSLPKGRRLEDPQRNIHFLLRNAPSPAPRGMEMSEEGKLIYSTEPYGDGLQGDETGPAI